MSDVEAAPAVPTIEAKISSQREWTPEDLLIISAIPNVSNATILESDAKVVSAHVPLDKARPTITSIARAFPDTPISWATDFNPIN